MGVAKSVGVIAAGAAWRLGYPDWAGRALIDALGSEDESARTISIGDASIAPEVKRFVNHRDPKIAAAARDALRAFDVK